MQDFRHGKRQQWHNDVLRGEPDENRDRILESFFEIFEGQGAAETEHDEENHRYEERLFAGGEHEVEIEDSGEGLQTLLGLHPKKYLSEIVQQQRDPSAVAFRVDILCLAEATFRRAAESSEEIRRR